MTVSFHPAAEDELAGAIEHYFAISPELATRFADEIDAAVHDIATQPDRWPYYDPLAEARRWRRRLISGFPYLIVYEVRNDAVRILAVPHTAREPAYWRGRQ